MSDLVPGGFIIPVRFIKGFWVIIIFVSMFACVFADFLRVLNHWFHIFPDWFQVNYQWFKLGYFITLVASILIILFLGYRKYDEPLVSELTINIKKANPQNLSVIAASDLHLGNIAGRSKIEEWVQLINDQKPDLILLSGDIFDRNYNAEFANEFQSELRKLNSKFGIYAVLGNHEYYTDTALVSSTLTNSGIRLLIDETIEIPDIAVVIGRDDYTNYNRMSLDNLLVKADTNLPIIVLDHQPVHLKQVARTSIDLQISGHLHNGQFFPYNRFLRQWELPYGYRKIGNTHFFVTSGLGLRRVAFRFGSNSELVRINIRNKY